MTGVHDQGQSGRFWFSMYRCMVARGAPPTDSTLNRNGVRLGSADIHDVGERLPEITEALVIGAEEPDGGCWMPLFVVPAAGVTLDDGLREKIRETIRTGASPRHVPDEILEVPAVPHTLTGKKLEIPVKRLLQGASAEQVVNPAAVDAPELFDYCARLGADRRSRRNPGSSPQRMSLND